MSYSLNSGGYEGDYMGDYYIGIMKGDTKSLDYGSQYNRVDLWDSRGRVDKEMKTTVL